VVDVVFVLEFNYGDVEEGLGFAYEAFDYFVEVLLVILIISIFLLNILDGNQLWYAYFHHFCDLLARLFITIGVFHNFSFGREFIFGFWVVLSVGFNKIKHAFLYN
jgi:hypothetical protein